MNTWIKAAAVAIGVLSAPLVAQETLGSSGRGGGMGLLRMADANGDGVITRDEYTAAVDARFARMDTNGDGVLQASERPMHHMRGEAPEAPPPPAAQMGMAPPPPPPPPAHDVRRAKYRQEALRRFDRIDTNRDGKIDQAEMTAMATMMRFRDVPGGMDGHTPPPPPPAGE